MQKNQLLKEGGKHIGAALAKLTSLTQLKISFGKNLIEDAGVQSIISGIACCSKLRVLYLYAYNIGMTGLGCMSIAESIKQLTSLERFELFTNFNRHITFEKGLKQLA